jgi:ferredoxin-NADP reductase
MCGPHELVTTIASTIRAIGPGRPRVHRETFYIPSKKSQFDFSTLSDREIIIQTQGEEKLIIVKSGQSILQATLEQRIKVPSHVRRDSAAHAGRSCSAVK